MSNLVALKVVNEDVPITENGTVDILPVEGSPHVPRERRQYLTEREVEQLCEAARKRGRYGRRDQRDARLFKVG